MKKATHRTKDYIHQLSAHVKREYAVLGPAVLNERARFKDLLNKSLKSARSAQRPKRRASR